MRLRIVVVFIALCLFTASAVSAAIISLNFSENSGNQGFAGGELIGPLTTDSANWNTSNGLSPLQTNSLANLIDDTGANTGASVSWAAPNAWWGEDGTADDEHKLAVGYLDDGHAPTVTFSDIPYAEYRVYGLVSSDQAWAGNPTPTPFLHDDFQVNGVWAYGGGAASSTISYGSITDNTAVHGQFWTETILGSVTGNYWTVDSAGSTLTIVGNGRVDGRNPISGVIIQEIPEPASLLLLAVGGLLMWRRRR